MALADDGREWIELFREAGGSRVLIWRLWKIKGIAAFANFDEDRVEVVFAAVSSELFYLLRNFDEARPEGASAHQSSTKFRRLSEWRTDPGRTSGGNNRRND